MCVVLLTCCLHLAGHIWEMWCWSGGRATLTELSLCYSIVYCYNGAQRYEQFLQVGRLYRLALILLGLAICLQRASISSVFMVLYIYLNYFVTFFAFFFISMLFLDCSLVFAARCYASAAYVIMRCLRVCVCLCVHHVREFCQNE